MAGGVGETAESVLWVTALYLLMFSAYVVGGVVGILLYPRPESSFTRFWLLVIVGILFALAALYNPCIREESLQEAATSLHTFHQCRSAVMIPSSRSA